MKFVLENNNARNNQIIIYYELRRAGKMKLVSRVSFCIAEAINHEKPACRALCGRLAAIVHHAQRKWPRARASWRLLAETRSRSIALIGPRSVGGTGMLRGEAYARIDSIVAASDACMPEAESRRRCL